MARDAYSFIIPLGLLGGLCLLLGWWLVPVFFFFAFFFLLLALFVAFFFRDPEREVPTDEKLVVSPADGHVVVIKPFKIQDGPQDGPQEGNAGTLVSIFLSIFDVHINRSPLAGRIVSTNYRKGKFLIATKQKASLENEQNVITVQNEYTKVVFKQIAGLIARRIVFWKQAGDQVQLGERIGLIRFGSRVDIILPSQVTVLVKKGEHVKGGISIIGKVEI
ncbi:MAG: phosphatidylserine decarboxylase family protein [Acidobacteria bacterium]|nr:phosphatidylserine decarboxylase family protein [Acidobacteriota bacterium]